MAEVSVKINGRTYGLECDPGQEDRVQKLSSYVDARLREISASGAATSESQLLVLTSLILTDELFELKERMARNGQSAGAGASAGPDAEDEKIIVEAIDHLAGRIEVIAERMTKN